MFMILNGLFGNGYFFDGKQCKPEMKILLTTQALSINYIGYVTGVIRGDNRGIGYFLLN